MESENPYNSDKSESRSGGHNYTEPKDLQKSILDARLKSYRPNKNWVFTFMIFAVLSLFITHILENQLELATTQYGFCLPMVFFFLISSVNWLPFIFDDVAGLDRFRSVPFPTIFLSIGIFGTFLGIFIGLDDLTLNTANPFTALELSGLIEGLRLSMFTSLMGIFFAIFYRILIVFLGPVPPKETGADDIVDAVGVLADRLDSFVTDLSDKVGSGLADALKDLTSRLDEVLANQLGEAFRELNESITKLNAWVVEYREQVDTLTSAYSDNLTSIQTFHDEAQKITNALARVPQQASGIQDTLEKMNIPLSEFTELGARASDAFPIIEARLDQLTKDFSASSAKLSEVVASTAKVEGELAQKTENVEKLIKEATETQLHQFESQLAAISQKFSKDYLPIAEALKRALEAIDVRPSE